MWPVDPHLQPIQSTVSARPTGRFSTYFSQEFEVTSTRYPGHPTSPPDWYRDRGQSYIEKEFSDALDDLASRIESEHWFGDAEKHHRYRVDFILKDARLIVELDGHDYHSTKEQLEKDAERRLYLTRAGYTVINLTGRQINRDPAACVAKVRTLYKERMQRAPAKYRVLYIDYQFLMRQVEEAKRFYYNLHPSKQLQAPTLESFVKHAVGWLHEKSFITAFVFLPPEERCQIEHLDGTVTEYGNGEIRINVVDAELYSVELGSHMTSYSNFYDNFYLIGDDAIYIGPFREVLGRDPNQETGVDRSRGKILRKENGKTAYVGTDLASVPWQNVVYPIAAAMGLETHEL